MANRGGLMDKYEKKLRTIAENDQYHLAAHLNFLILGFNYKYWQLPTIFHYLPHFGLSKRPKEIGGIEF